jgi:WD40 repeat protein
MSSDTGYNGFNPYPGFRPFEPGESHLFFGRKGESEQILAKLHLHKCVTVIGEAGIGKTSLLTCGLIPLLEASGDGREWKILTFTPGSDPLRNLADAIEGQMTAGNLATIKLFPENPDGIAGIIRDLEITTGEKILIVIDQFEELFRYSSLSAKSSANAVRFVDSLVRTINQALDIYIVILIRSEFIGECTRFQGLTQVINDSSFIISRMSSSQYREIIEEPLKYKGASIDPELVNILVENMDDRTIQLPVLQHLMMRIWECSQQNGDQAKIIGISEYEAAGTISGALAMHAEEVYRKLDNESRVICEKMFRMISGKRPENTGFRKPAAAIDILSVASCRAEELFMVIDFFRERSLPVLLPSAAKLNPGTVIDIRYECIINHWGRLGDWIDAETSSVQMYLKLSSAAAMYQQGKTGLLKSPELQAAVDWKNREKPALEWARSYDPAFERVIVYLRTSEAQYREAEENSLVIRKRKAGRYKALSAIFGVAAIIAVFLTIIAFSRARTAGEERAAEEMRRLVSDSARVEAENMKILSDAATVEAAGRIEKIMVDLKVAEDSRKIIAENARDSITEMKWFSDKAVSERNRAMQLRMISVGKTMSLKSIGETDRKDLQALLAYQAYLFNRKHDGYPNDPDIYAGLYNIARQSGLSGCRTFSGHAGKVTSIAYLPGRNEFVTSGSDGRIIRWNLAGNEKAIQVVYSGIDSSTGALDVTEVLAVSPDAAWLAAGTNNSIRMIPLSRQSEGYVLQEHAGKIKSLVWSFDGKYLYSAALDGRVLKWDLAARTSIDMTDGSVKINSIDVSSSGNYIAGVSSDGSVLVWDPEKRTGSFSIDASGKDIRTIRFNPESNILAIGDASGLIELWDVAARRKISQVQAHSGTVNDIRFNAALKQMASAGSDGMLKIFGFSEPSELSIPPVTFREDAFITVIQFSSDGQLLLTGSNTGPDNVMSRPCHADYMIRDVGRLLTRNMTPEEWNLYVAADIPLEQPYPVRDFSIRIKAVPSSEESGGFKNKD